MGGKIERRYHSIFQLKSERDSTAVRSDAQIIYSCSSDTEATDDDPVVRELRIN